MSSDPPPGLTSEQLRAAVRAVLRETLPALAADLPPAAPERGEPDQTVDVRTDEDLAAFVRRVAALCDDETVRADLHEGRRRFRLARESQPVPPAAVHRVERGAVTERRVQQAAAEGARLLLGRKAVLTPLGRDRARTLGVIVEREA